jgi:hypothetical protein
LDEVEGDLEEKVVWKRTLDIFKNHGQTKTTHAQKCLDENLGNVF